MRAEPPQAGLLTHASTAARAFSGFPNDRLSPCTRPPRIQRRYRPGFSPGSLSSPAARTAAEALEASIALSITRADFFVKPVPVCVSAFAKKIRISVLDRRARMVYNQSSPHKACAAGTEYSACRDRMYATARGDPVRHTGKQGNGDNTPREARCASGITVAVSVESAARRRKPVIGKLRRQGGRRGGCSAGGATQKTYWEISIARIG